MFLGHGINALRESELICSSALKVALGGLLQPEAIKFRKLISWELALVRAKTTFFR